MRLQLRCLPCPEEPAPCSASFQTEGTPGKGNEGRAQCPPGMRGTAKHEETQSEGSCREPAGVWRGKTH